MKRKGLDAMAAFAKLLVLIAIFLLESNANAFTCLSPIARNQVPGNHFIQFEESMNDPKNEPSQKPTKQKDWDAELPSNLSSKQLKYTCENILSGYLYVLTKAFSQQEGIYGLKPPQRCLEISSGSLFSQFLC
jgi:hypothetical protein